jgi:H+/gluconate symporter-like permease
LSRRSGTREKIDGMADAMKEILAVVLAVGAAGVFALMGVAGHHR